MASQTSLPSQLSMRVEWMWQSNPDPWSNLPQPEWNYYSDVENLIIEEAFSAKTTHVQLDEYYIDFECNLQIPNNDQNKRRPVKRVIYSETAKRIRRERILSDSMTPNRSFGGQYGWVPLFILEVKKYLELKPKQLPSRDSTVVPRMVAMAAVGIIEESEKIGKRCEGEKLSKLLLEQKNKGIQEVWKCCAVLYTMDSFLYRKLNEAMRMVGSDEHELVWRSKIPTLGPFCLLLWDDPLHDNVNVKTTLYRAANLSDDQINSYKDLCNSRNYGSFQAFTSSSRNIEVAKFYDSNTLFIMEIDFAFTADVSSFSKYPDEEEELISPGVSFSVQCVKFDESTQKHEICLTIVQRFTDEDVQQPTTITKNKNNDIDQHQLDQYCLYAYDSYDEDDDIRDDLLNPSMPGNWYINRYDRDGNPRY